MTSTREAIGIDRNAAIAWYKKNRVRTATLFDLLTDEAYYAQPISLRHPIVFYEGHLPAFSLNTLVKKALGRPGLDESLERLFARGIDPDEAARSVAVDLAVDVARDVARDFSPAKAGAWPDRSQVRAFVDAADRLVLDALATADLEVPGHPLLDGSAAVYTILEHEAMHQETLLYMWHRLPFDQKRVPDDYHLVTGTAAGQNDEVPIPPGTVRLGASPGEIPFGWDNECGPLDVDVDAFTIHRRNVTNGEFAEFVEAGGYSQPDLWSAESWNWLAEQGIQHPSFWERNGSQWMWLGMFERVPLPAEWPVYVSHAEAVAFARWRGRRLPTEAEYHRVAYGAPDNEPRAFPWGNDSPTRAHGVFDFTSWEPHPVDTHPAGRSAWGVDDLVGNGWEWTSSIFRPFPLFAPSPSYPEYSTDFFDESHYVMKGASPATARELLRPTFRNWFRPRYPYVYATFRLAGEGV